jgi:hypothetical protein
VLNGRAFATSAVCFIADPQFEHRRGLGFGGCDAKMLWHLRWLLKEAECGGEEMSKSSI